MRRSEPLSALSCGLPKAHRQGRRRSVGIALLALCLGSFCCGSRWAHAQSASTSQRIEFGAEEVARRWTLANPLVHIVDGDTVDVDLNGNGQLDIPGERLRLLYVDTPELEPNPKGQDVAHGLPAKAALETLLAAGSLDIQVLRGNEQDRFGRTLARVRTRSVDVNLELVRLGHSPLDTRFSYPADYPAYVRAEAEAFTARRGIWADTPSRKHYLARLKKEGRTPQALDNTLCMTGVQGVASLDAAAAVGQYVVVDGVVRERRPLRNGVWQFVLGDAERTTSSRALTVVAFPKVAQGFEVAHWPLSARVRVEGFVAKYRGKVELQLQWAEVSP